MGMAPTAWYAPGASCFPSATSFHSSGASAAGRAAQTAGSTPYGRPGASATRGTTLASLGLGPVAGLGAVPDEGAAQAFFRGRWPIIAALGFGASGLLAYSVFHQPVVTQRVYLDFDVNGAPAGRVVLGLFGREAPHTCENFAALASHERGFGYRGCPVHRVMRGWSVWAGDVTAGDGSGGVSVFGPSFPVESHSVRHRRGTVSMVLDEEGRLRSQFFFTLVTTPALDRKAAAFGRVLEGVEVLDRLSRLPTHEGDDSGGRPRADVRIADCGVLPEPEATAAVTEATIARPMETTMATAAAVPAR